MRSRLIAALCVTLAAVGVTTAFHCGKAQDRPFDKEQWKGYGKFGSEKGKRYAMRKGARLEALKHKSLPEALEVLGPADSIEAIMQNGKELQITDADAGVKRGAYRAVFDLMSEPTGEGPTGRRPSLVIEESDGRLSATLQDFTWPE